MCTTSMVGQVFHDRWTQPYVASPYDSTVTLTTTTPTRAEFDALKAEVLEMRELMIAAKRIDELTGQPDCEDEAKLSVLRKVAELVGVDLADVI